MCIERALVSTDVVCVGRAWILQHDDRTLQPKARSRGRVINEGSY